MKISKILKTIYKNIKALPLTPKPRPPQTQPIWCQQTQTHTVSDIQRAFLDSVFLILQRSVWLLSFMCIIMCIYVLLLCVLLLAFTIYYHFALPLSCVSLLCPEGHVRLKLPHQLFECCIECVTEVICATAFTHDHHERCVTFIICVHWESHKGLVMHVK